MKSSRMHVLRTHANRHVHDLNVLLVADHIVHDWKGCIWIVRCHAGCIGSPSSDTRLAEGLAPDDFGIKDVLFPWCFADGAVQSSELCRSIDAR